MKSTFARLFPVVALALVLAGCDATGPADTVILNSSSAIPPTVEYTFAYDTEGQQQIGVRSLNPDTLASILRRNGFGRSDVVSARVDRVVLERVSDPGAVAREKKGTAPKVFSYLTGATLYLGADASGTEIASATIESSDDRPPKTRPLTVTTANVTDVVKAGSQPAFLVLTAGDDVPDRRDRVRVTVDFRIEVQGV